MRALNSMRVCVEWKNAFILSDVPYMGPKSMLLILLKRSQSGDEVAHAYMKRTHKFKTGLSDFKKRMTGVFKRKS